MHQNQSVFRCWFIDGDRQERYCVPTRSKDKKDIIEHTNKLSYFPTIIWFYTHEI